MARYIDAEQFLKSMITKFKCVPLLGVSKYIYGEECFEGEHLDALINEAPTADVVEVRRGEWIEKVNSYNYSDEDFEYLECSICGNCSPVQNPTPYCSECGAKMDKEKGGAE